MKMKEQKIIIKVMQGKMMKSEDTETDKNKNTGTEIFIDLVKKRYLLNRL